MWKIQCTPPFSPGDLLEILDPQSQASYKLASDAHIPVVVVADDEDILSLLHAAVVQRKRLNCKELPIVGILIPKEGIAFRILVGWADDHSVSLSEYSFERSRSNVLRTTSCHGGFCCWHEPRDHTLDYEYF